MAAELAQMTVGVDVRLLHHVLGGFVAAQNAAHDAIDGLVMPAHQHFEQRRLTAKNIRDHLLIRKRVALFERASTNDMHSIGLLSY